MQGAAENEIAIPRITPSLPTTEDPLRKGSAHGDNDTFLLRHLPPSRGVCGCLAQRFRVVAQSKQLPQRPKVQDLVRGILTFAVCELKSMVQLRSSFVAPARFSVAVTPPRAVGPRQVTCMARKKGVRCIITIECTEARGLGMSPSRYTTQKNKKNTPDRLELKKYNPALKRMTVHKEIK